MPYRVDIYIGSDNRSRRISREYVSRILEWADETFPEGYTIIRGRGSYRGVAEDSLLVSILSNNSMDLKEPLTNLKQRLRQDAIMLAKSQVEIEVI